MTIKNEDPARVGRGAPKTFKFAAVNDPDNSQTQHDFQAFRAAWIARRSRLPLTIAATLAPPPFGGEVR